MVKRQPRCTFRVHPLLALDLAQPSAGLPAFAGKASKASDAQKPIFANGHPLFKPLNDTKAPLAQRKSHPIYPVYPVEKYLKQDIQDKSKGKRQGYHCVFQREKLKRFTLWLRPLISR